MNWKTTAQRLKELREEKGLSHAKLKELLEDKYEGFSISELSLKKYEVSDENHQHAKSVCGMKTEYLYYLADFYDVSTDYLVGKSNCKKMVIDDVLMKTGLSEKAISVLIEHKEKNYVNDTLLPGLSFLIENEDFNKIHHTTRPPILSIITNYLFSGRMKNTNIICIDENGIAIKSREEAGPRSMYLDIFPVNLAVSKIYFDRLNERLRSLRTEFQNTPEYLQLITSLKSEKEVFFSTYFKEKKD